MELPWEYLVIAGLCLAPVVIGIFAKRTFNTSALYYRSKALPKKTRFSNASKRFR